MYLYTFTSNAHPNELYKGWSAKKKISRFYEAISETCQGL
jgi:predicted ATPase